VAAGNQALTWSRDGSWLFVATTAAGEVDAVDVQGRVYTVEAPSLAGAAVLTR
jgi:sugar lactone lactonase YvrE